MTGGQLSSLTAAIGLLHTDHGLSGPGICGGMGIVSVVFLSSDHISKDTRAAYIRVLCDVPARSNGEYSGRH